MRIGIRREDKSRFEARAPLVPADVADLAAKHGVEVTVEPSETRLFRNDAYQQAGARISTDLSDCGLILGVKEIPNHVFLSGRAYLFFSHTIKGQSYNMPMLRRMMELGCTLIDYERITDDRGRRLVLFGPFAGLAGMIDTLWILGRRLEYEGIENPFKVVRQALHYSDISEAKTQIAELGADLRRHGLPAAVDPLVFAFTGYGNVSRGAQEIYDLLPVTEISREELLSLPPSAHGCYKVVFHEEHLVERIDGSRPFDLKEYYDHPDRYRSTFRPCLDRMTVLVNCIYWEPKYPRLVSRGDLKELFGGRQPPRLRIISDISCDIEGSVECTVRACDPGDPVYVFDPATGETHNGVAGHGPVVLANNILPCELPVDASQYFSQALRGFIPTVTRADLTKPLVESGLPPELQRATILYRGELTPAYGYLTQYVG